MDVDLEDRLLLGLPPLRLGYVAIAALVALGAWRAVPLVGGVVAVAVAAIGAAFGWGQWRGRGPDHWVVAAALWLGRTRQLELTLKVGPRPPVPSRRRPMFRPRPPASIHVLHVLSEPERDP